ncbi:hypothetical protein BDR26DRAFT_204170 [Obelidium mucronatum]|nr:hypothetical protein BDR26DRAFT_204170 [Obelidium mucronatum]
MQQQQQQHLWNMYPTQSQVASYPSANQIPPFYSLYPPLHQNPPALPQQQRNGSSSSSGSLNGGVGVRKSQSRPHLQQHNQHHSVLFQTPTNPSKCSAKPGNHSASASPLDERKEAGGLDGDDSVGGASGGDNTVVADEDCIALSPTTNGDAVGVSDLASADVHDSLQGGILDHTLNETRIANGAPLQEASVVQPHATGSASHNAIGTKPAPHKNLYSRKSFTTLPLSRQQQVQQQQHLQQISYFAQQQQQQLLFLQQQHQQHHQQQPQPALHFPPSSPQLFHAPPLPLPPTGPYPQLPMPPMMAVNTHQQQHHVFNNSVISPTSPYGYLVPGVLSPQHQQSPQAIHGGWLFGGTEPQQQQQHQQQQQQQQQQGTDWKKKASRRGKKRGKRTNSQTTTATTIGSESVGSSSGGFSTTLSLDAPPFSPMDTSNGSVDGGNGCDGDEADLASANGVAGSVGSSSGSRDDDDDDDEGEARKPTVPKVPVARLEISTSDARRREVSASLSPRASKGKVLGGVGSPLSKSPSRIVHPLPPKPPASPKIKSKMKLVEVVNAAAATEEAAVGESDGVSVAVVVDVVAKPASVVSPVVQSTQTVGDAKPAPMTAVKKVVKAVSVTKSNVSVPAGPFARLGDLYAFVKKQLPAESNPSVMEAVTDAFGFSKAAASENGPWSVLSRLDADVFAIGTASSDNRRHLLIPSHLFPKLRQFVVESVRERIGDTMFDLKPFYVSSASSGVAPVISEPVSPVAGDCSQIICLSRCGNAETKSDVIGRIDYNCRMRNRSGFSRFWSNPRAENNVFRPDWNQNTICR